MTAAGDAPGATVVVVPGRGEHPGLYDRFARRLAARGHRVVPVGDPTAHEVRVAREIAAVLDGDGAAPRVLVGSDAGALFAAALVADGTARGVAGLVLAGLVLPEAPLVARSWERELDARTACPAHRLRLAADAALHRGALHRPPPRAWGQRARPGAIAVPVLGLHGGADAVAPLDTVAPWYAGAPAAELIAVAGGRHDVLNDRTHDTVAATVASFLERVRATGAPAEVAR
jgi:alpha-beta hydrolase superfamily lysophospholipase